jgi:hypothetical protein
MANEIEKVVWFAYYPGQGFLTSKHSRKKSYDLSKAVVYKRKNDVTNSCYGEGVPVSATITLDEETLSMLALYADGGDKNHGFDLIKGKK